MIGTDGEFLTILILGYSFVLLVVVPVAFWFNGRIDG